MTKDIKPNKPSFFQRLRNKTKLSIYISIIIGLTTGICLFVFGFLSLKILRENKVRDIVMILHYDADNLTKQLAQEFEHLNEALVNGQLKNKTYKVVLFDPKTKKYLNIKGLQSSTYTPDELGVPPEGPKKKTYITNIDGSLFLVKKAADLPWLKNSENPESLLLFDFNFGIFGKTLNLIKEETLTYLVSTDGHLLFSNSPEITQVTLPKRLLAKKFTESPLESMQMQYHDAKQGDIYGFFASIDEANIVVFVETSQRIITKKIDKIKVTFFYYTAGILLAAILFVNLGMTSVYTTLRRLVEFTEKISRGEFNVAIQPSSFGELNSLTGAFSAMSNSLIKRDERIKVLIEKERLGALTQLELGIARQIQDSFLPKADEKFGKSISIASYYMPAGFVAGDWYGIHEDKEGSKFYLIIADVSGHGAGASMYTAMIASLFEHAREDNFAQMNVVQFFHRINTILFKIGKTQWHSSMQCAEFYLKENRVVITNAGHPPPILFEPGETETKTRVISSPSDLLGFTPDCKIVQQELPLTKGMGLLMYTDGLIEARNVQGRLFSTKRLLKIIKDHRNTNSSILVDMVKRDLTAWINTTKSDDDVCMISFRYLG